MKRVIAIAGTCLLLAGCGAGAGEIRVSGGEPEENQKVEEVLKEKDGRIVSAVAVFVHEDLLVGVQVKPFSRFSKTKIEEELTKELEKAFPEETVTLSTDLKIFWETDKLDELEEEDKLHKKVETIKSLSKEET
ncbi:hypothetical protein AV656_05310 [Bhargavaea cecembensis]|uniref:Sporulation protein n=1 Tax=Bhargavaea cecembensis TaxID=394098 RepID=A0A163FBU5_9BACL|nr:hypothetical protein [Bhargavaea cecembensis]KZE38336.1 hypothetical protein AV656_05310 [Bhargavaea cecembensis]